MFFLKSKKAQFYIVGAIILCGLAISLVTTTVLSRNSRTIFDEFRLNFMRESSFAINSALGSNKDVAETFDSFVISFRNYASERNLDFNLIYILQVDDVMYMKNYLDGDVEVQYSGTSTILPAGQSYNMTSVADINIKKLSDEFTFSFDDSSTQLRAVFEMKVK